MLKLTTDRQTDKQITRQTNRQDKNNMPPIIRSGGIIKMNSKYFTLTIYARQNYKIMDRWTIQLIYTLVAPFNARGIKRIVIIYIGNSVISSMVWTSSKTGFLIYGWEPVSRQCAILRQNSPEMQINRWTNIQTWTPFFPFKIFLLKSYKIVSSTIYRVFFAWV